MTSPEIPLIVTTPTIKIDGRDYERRLELPLYEQAGQATRAHYEFPSMSTASDKVRDALQERVYLALVALISKQ